MSDKSLITNQSVAQMIKNRDMSPAVGHASELIAVLLKASPQILEEGMKVACENAKLKKEIIDCIHETVKTTKAEQSILAQSQVNGINEVTKNLSEAVVNWSKRDNLSSDEIQICYMTLQTLNGGLETQSNSIQENMSFEERLLKTEQVIIESTKHNNSINQVFSALRNVLKTPEGQQAVRSAARLVTSIIMRGIVK